MPEALMDALVAAILIEQDRVRRSGMPIRRRPMRGSAAPFSVAAGAAAEPIARAFDPSLSAMMKALG
jgi:hypothetical protein